VIVIIIWWYNAIEWLYEKKKEWLNINNEHYDGNYY